MDRSDILKEIMKVLQKYEGRGANRVSISEATSLANELDIDSARMVDIVIDLEGKFNVSIDDSRLDGLKSVGDVVSLIQSLQAA
jgi:acyl carrier protein